MAVVMALHSTASAAAAGTRNQQSTLISNQHQPKPRGHKVWLLLFPQGKALLLFSGARKTTNRRLEIA